LKQHQNNIFWTLYTTTTCKNTANMSQLLAEVYVVTMINNIND